MAALGLLLGWGAGLHAHAQTAQRVQVLLVLDAGLKGASGFGDALGAQLSDLDVEIVSRAAEGEIPAAALALARANRSAHDRGVVWVAQQGQDLLVFVVEPGAHNTLVRSLPQASPAVFSTQETVAVIVRSSIEGLLSGAPIGFVPPVVAAPAGPAPVPAATRQPALFMPELGVGYVGASFAQQVPWQHGVRVAAGVSDVFARGPYALLAVSLLRDERVVDRGVSLLLSRTPVEVVGGVRFVFGGFAVAPEVGLGLEVTKRDAQAADPSVKAYAERKRVSALFSGHLWLLRALGGPQARSWLSIGGGVEAVLNNVDYRIEIRRPGESRSTTSILVHPRSFRPIALAAIVVKL